MTLKPDPFNLVQALHEALALHQQGRLDDAERLYTRLIKMQRDNHDAMHLLGMLNHQRGKASEAYRLISAALKVAPRSPDALSNLGLVLHALQRDAEALSAVDKALALAPDHIEALNNRGNLLLAMKRPADALSAFEQVLAREPRHLQARVNRGTALAETGQSERAIAEYDAALAMHPQNPHALYNRGNALRALGREAEAIASYDKALALAPSHVTAWYNRGLALQALNRHADALASFAKALAVEPDNADVHFGQAASLLTLGDYPRGFAEYEWRWKRSGMTARRNFRSPLWLGDTPLSNKTILLHAEQGVGDTIQFARYAPLLARMGGRVVLEVLPELKTLLAGLEGVAAILGRGEGLPPFDLHCPLASLPLACKTELASVPAGIPYLRASEERIAHWRARLAALPSPRVAIAWSGRATHVNDRQRSVAFAQLAPLLSLPNVSFVSVQRELREQDRESLSAAPNVLSIGEQLTDFADTAAVLSLADLVISVDTAVAHLAAAQGLPTWVLLPFQPDWRWTLGERSRWYPAARLFRQPRPSDWNSVISQVRETLASMGSAVT